MSHVVRMSCHGAVLQILDEEVEASMKEAAVISMGTEVSEHDMVNIKALCDQVGGEGGGGGGGDGGIMEACCGTR